VDIDLPGNSALPVQLRRRFVVSALTEGALRDPDGGIGNPYGGAGNWDVDVPYIYGVFDSEHKWDTPNGGTTPQPRCSSTPFVPGTRPGFSSAEVWSGNKVHIPGEGDLGMLVLDSAWPPLHAAADGQSHQWTTTRFDSFTCKGTSNGSYGEGFVMTTPEGIKYTFDVYLERWYAGVSHGTLGSIGYNPRLMIFLLASQVTDRYGNWVKYTYDGAGHPKTISSNDGRLITLTYDPNDASRLQSATVTLSAPAQTRTWSYGYQISPKDQLPQLTSVTLPDDSQWTYTYSNTDYLYVRYTPLDTSGLECGPASYDPASFTLGMTHPSGSRGTFQFQLQRHRRNLPSSPSNCQNGQYVVPPHVDTFSLVSKTISATADTSSTWTYSYGLDFCGTCTSAKNRVVQPDGSFVESRYSTMCNATGAYAPAGASIEGQLLQTDVLTGLNGTVLRSTINQYITGKDVADQPFTGQPFPSRYGVIWGADDPASGSLRPLQSTSITQSGATFTRRNNTFDDFGRPLEATLSSTLGYSRTETTTYKDYLDIWVLGLVDTVVDSTLPNSAVVDNGYDAKGSLTSVTEFGRLKRSMTYNDVDGTLKTVKDGANKTTTLGPFKRGIPTSVTYADGTSQSAVIDEAGSIRSVTNEVGATTTYDYNIIGRLTKITYPTEADGLTWNATTIDYVRTTATDMGVTGPHWRQTTTTGNAKKVVEYDARWRPVMTLEYDSANQAATQRRTLRNYDYANRETFVSYPYAADGKTLPGVWTAYDALGRVTSVTQDSELGPLVTLTEYLSGFQKRVTDPRGKVTTTTFKAYDTPSEDAPMTIVAAVGTQDAVTTTFTRDTFNKPLSVTRSGSFGGQVSQTRRYVYDANQLLCKTIEPEIGATIQDYDLAGNVAWFIKGSTLTSQTCDRANVAASSRTNYGYDARDRVIGVAYPLGTTPISNTYYEDGLLKTTDNNGSTWTYSYNRRRLLETEALSLVEGQQTFLVSRSYDRNGSLSALVYPDDTIVSFQPNALGQPTQAGSYATGITYYPNGAVKGFTYGNGILHGLTQNARQLPARSKDGAVSDLSYDYDANANVAAITDNAQGGLESRTMQYDGLNRLTGTSAPALWGSASFSYDPLDNLRTSTVGIRSCTHSYNASTNQLVSISGTNCPTLSYAYDSQGNVTQRGSQAFVFDRADRMKEATGKESYMYDGLGRRFRIARADGTRTYQVYSKDGQLLYGLNAADGSATRYVYLNGSLVARSDVDGPSGGPPAPGGLTAAPNPSPDGAYRVTWNEVAGATRYVLKEQANGGAETTVYDGTDTQWSASGKPVGPYVYRVQACNPECGAWSDTFTEQVQPPPAAPASITATPNPSPDGSYQVDWSSVPSTIAYLLEEQVGNDPTWTVVQSDWPTTWSTSGRPNGTYRYRVRAWNLSGYGGYSPTVTVTVQITAPLPPPAWIRITPSPVSTSGNYTVDWGSVPGTIAYLLEEQVGTSTTWNTVHSDWPATWSASGKPNGTYRYRARAWNMSGYSPYTPVVTEIVQAAPPAVPLPPTLLLTNNPSTDGRYTVSWNEPNGATSYGLQEKYRYGSENQYGDADWRDVPTSGRTWSPNPPKTGYGDYSYRVKACNVSGCSGYSNVAVEQVRLPNVLPDRPSISAIAPNPSTDGNFTVTWTAMPRATRYFLQERINAATTSWNDVTPAGGTTGTSWSTPTPRANGIYVYRVKACNDYGCSDYSLLTGPAQETVQIPTTLPMTTPTNFRVMGAGAVGQAYKFYWDTVNGAASYNLKEEFWNCGGSTPIVTLIPANAPQPYKIVGRLSSCGGQTQDPSTYRYSIQACNGATCSGWSPTVEMSVSTPPRHPEGSATTTTYVHTDGLHSPVAETNATGAVTARTRYEPYGSTLLPPAQGPGYAGHVTDAATGLGYMQQRYYDPMAGRFLSVDPVAASAGGFNRYWYADNNPYKYIDPDGRCPKNLGSNLCIESATFNPSRSSGRNVVGTPAMDSAVSNQKRVVQTRPGSRNEPLASLNEQKDGSLKVQPIAGTTTESGDNADKASGRPPTNSKAIVHGHTSRTVSDDQYSIGDANPLKQISKPNYAVSQDGRVMVQELENGRYQVRMVVGKMTEAETKYYTEMTTKRQELFYDH